MAGWREGTEVMLGKQSPSDRALSGGYASEGYARPEARRVPSRGTGKVLLTSICRPIGPAHGDAPSVGYELLHGQVTRAQGIFSPRATHHTFALDYIATNLDAPAVVLHYPSRKELIRELRKQPEIVGVSFVLATFHRMKEMVGLIRKHAPNARVVLGGYGLCWTTKRSRLTRTTSAGKRVSAFFGRSSASRRVPCLTTIRSW